jgi:hypothetical protein
MADQGKSPQNRTWGRVLFANLLGLTGFAMLGRGLWIQSPALALTVLGLLLLVAGILARFR